MAYTEVRTINRRKYYYRVISLRQKDKISKKRVYLGWELSGKDLSEKEMKADKKLLPMKKKKKNKEIDNIKSKTIKILKREVEKAGIFGSYARGEQKKDSDIDLVVKIKNDNMSLIGFIGLKLELEEALGKKVDLVEYSVIKPRARDNILKEEIRII